VRHTHRERHKHCETHTLRHTIRHAIYAGIISLIIFLSVVPIKYFALNIHSAGIVQISDSFRLPVQAFITSLYHGLLLFVRVMLSLVFIWGFKIVADYYKSKLLKISVIALISIILPVVLILFVRQNLPDLYNFITSNIISEGIIFKFLSFEPIIVGIAAVIFGYSIFILRPQLGRVVNFASTLSVVHGLGTILVLSWMLPFGTRFNLFNLLAITFGLLSTFRSAPYLWIPLLILGGVLHVILIALLIFILLKADKAIRLEKSS